MTVGCINITSWQRWRACCGPLRDLLDDKYETVINAVFFSLSHSLTHSLTHTHTHTHTKTLKNMHKK